ncbi:MAG: hypothetical protein JO151_13320 [Verrucomicrobia bacterium]|nr:hypothetical protein [Verrucomicrobiota bacterium]
MDVQLTDSDTYTHLTGALDRFLNLEPLVNSIQGVLNDYQPAAYVIAFIVLVIGTMREFLYPESRRFLHSGLRALLLVATISFASNFIEWCDQAAQALARLPAAREVNFGDSSYSINPGEAPTITQLEQVLQAKVAGTAPNKGNQGNKLGKSQNNPQFSANPLDFGRNLGIVWSYIAGFTQNLAWEILFAIYLLCLLLCKVIILLMQFVQKVVVIGFKLYTPIAVAEYAHRSLQGKAISFFLTFIGLLAWPVGWSLVNTVTLGIFRSLPAPENQNFATLMIAIVLAVPVLLWVLIGHVLAPIFVQKAIIRGGAAIQGFVGTIVSAVGAGSTAIYSSGLLGAANWSRIGKQDGSQGLAGLRSGGYSANNGPERLVLEPFDGYSTPQKGANRLSETRLASDRKEQDRARREQSNFGAGIMDSGAALMNRFGSVARFIGHAVIEGSGEGSGLEYRALAAFAPSGANARSSANQTNRSSLQARKYVDEW